MRRRVRILMGGAVMALSLSGCQVVPGYLYPNHGFPFCSLQSGPEPYPGEVFGGITAFPILGDLLWEACFNHGPF